MRRRGDSIGSILLNIVKSGMEFKRGRVAIRHNGDWSDPELTGMFLETSKRSAVTYLFRRLRPTVAIGRNKDGGGNIMAALCLHPIAYYAGSWAGAMCPTDDVLAHYCLMRGDEKMFWRRANQHAAFRPEAGL
jgi:hypothetical protein